MKSIHASAMVMAAGLMLSAGAALAQDLNEETDFGLPQYYGRGKNISVMERDRPDYEAVGIRAGGFTLLPKLELGTDFTDNIYAVNSNANSPNLEPNGPGLPSPFNGPKSDIGFIINPSITAQSNWGRHSLTVYASVKNETFASNSSENTTAYTLQTNGRIDVHGDSYINLGFDGEHDYEPRGNTLTQTAALTPVPYDTEGAYIRGLFASDRLRIAVDGDIRNYHYYNIEQLNIGTPVTESTVDETFRDFTQGRLALRSDYALTPDEAVFGKLTYSNGDYINGNVANPKRSYDEYRFLGGANFDITALARGEIGIGYIDRSYSDSAYKGITGLAASAKIEYFPTQLITVTLTGQRLVQDAAFSTASGYFQNIMTLGADYELKRNIILSAIGSVEVDQFQGIDRSDTVSDFKLLGKYFVSRYVGLGATLDYTNRGSSGNVAAGQLGPIFDETRITFSLVFQR